MYNYSRILYPSTWSRFFSATASGQGPKQPDSSDFPATLSTANEKSEQLPTTNEKSEQLSTANQIAEQRQR